MNSLKKLALLVSVVFTPLFLRAETHYEGNIFVGGKAGIGFSRVVFHPTVRQNMQPGAVFGVQGRYIEEKHFGIIAELNFEQRGWAENFEGAPFSYHRLLNYLQLPVLAHIYFGSDKVHFFVNAGPEIGVMMGQNTISNFDYKNVESVPDFPIKDRQTAELNLKAPKKLDFGISAGLGGEYFLDAKQSVTLEARFYYGLGNVIKTGRTETFSSANSLGIMVTAGYWFRMK